MKIKAALLFRMAEKYVNGDGEEMLRVRFEDDQCETYTAFVPLAYNEKYLNMKKDTMCNVEFNIYKTNKNPRYAMYINL